MKFDEGDKVSQYRLTKLMKGHVQEMWQAEDTKWKKIALTTIYDGGQAEVHSSIEMNQLQFCLARSETQQFRWIWDSKKEEMIRFTCIGRLDLKPKREKPTPPPAPTPDSTEVEKIGDEASD